MDSPAAEPVNLSEAKAWIKVANSYTDDDTIITALITVAREQLEQYLAISIPVKDVTAVLCNEAGGIFIPYAPVNEITAVYDENDEELDETGYGVTIGSFPQLKYPVTSVVKVEYEAGYATVPEALKRAVLMQIAYLYEHRGDEIDSIGISKDALMVAKTYNRNGIFF